MVRFNFKKGLRFRQGNLLWTLMRRTATSQLQFECDATGEIQMLADREVHKRWLDGSWLVDEKSLGPAKELIYLATPKDFNALKAEAQVDVKRKLCYLTGVRESLARQKEKLVCDPDRIARVIKEVALELGDNNPPHWATFWRWWSAYSSTQCFSKLVDGRHRNRYKTDPVQFSVFEEVVNEIFLTEQKKPGKAVVNAVKDRYHRMNQGVEAHHQLKPPSPATIYRWLNNLCKSIVDEARLGKAHTRRELRIVTGTVHVEDLLERVEIDHTPVDLLVVCKVTRMVLGRPWLTLVLDRRSRMILGFYISFHTPSAYSVLYAMRMAILPKDALTESIGGIRNPWPARGLPRLMVMDNGMELHSKALDNFALEAGIELQYCGAAHPEMKGAVERVFRTISHDLFHQLPGTVFHNINARGDYPSEKKAALDIETLTQILVKWIVDSYHCTPHRGLKGRTPLQVWQELESKRTFDLPAYPRQLDLIVGHIASRGLFSYGIQYDSIFYNSTILGTLKERCGKEKRVQIRVYEHDISYIDVLLTDTDEYIRVPAIDEKECKGMTRHAHALVLNVLRRRYGDEWTQEQLRLTRAEIQQRTADAMRNHKKAVRKEAAARRLQDSDGALGIRASQAFSRSAQPAELDEPPMLPVLAASTILPQFSVTHQTLERA